MEFDYIGKHCSLSTCNQKDFLPFKCDYCHRDFCLDHRSYACHGCDGALSKDVTSTDCPMCGKSIRFTKAQDPNVVWEEHYLHGCTQQTQQKVSKKCAKSDCRVALGPSNSFTCSKCRQTVCISHRFSDDHNCAAALRQIRADAIQSKLGNQQKLPTSTKSSKSSSSTSSIGSKKTAQINDENSLRGSAGRRIQVTKPISPTPITSSSSSTPGSQSDPIIVDMTSNPNQCPFLCGLAFNNLVDLNNHINTAHNDNSSTSVSSSSLPVSNSSNTANNETVSYLSF